MTVELSDVLIAEAPHRWKQLAHHGAVRSEFWRIHTIERVTIDVQINIPRAGASFKEISDAVIRRLTAQLPPQITRRIILDEENCPLQPSRPNGENIGLVL